MEVIVHFQIYALNEFDWEVFYDGRRNELTLRRG